jgi:hypothetical protein
MDRRLHIDGAGAFRYSCHAERPNASVSRSRAGCSDPALALLKYDIRQKPPLMLGICRHFACESPKFYDGSCTSPSNTGCRAYDTTGEPAATAESATGGLPAPDNAYPPAVSPSRRPATKPRHSPGWKCTSLSVMWSGSFHIQCPPAPKPQRMAFTRISCWALNSTLGGHPCRRATCSTAVARIAEPLARRPGSCPWRGVPGAGALQRRGYGAPAQMVRPWWGFCGERFGIPAAT